jgi:phage minor structural protein
VICIYEANTTTWTGNGLCILQPSSCTVKEIAGGDFGLTLIHPITEDLRWKELQEERIIKAPVPAYRPLEDDGTVIVPAEQATEQCFRIYSVAVDTANHEVAVEARHISYDFMGNMCGRLPTQMGTYVVNALAKMRNALFTPDDRILATNITRRVNLGDRSFVNPIKFLLDPEYGLVQRARARLVRDNNDFYLLGNDEPADRGYEIAYGKNMTGISWSKSTDEVITRIVPLGEDADGKTLLLPEKWMDSPHIGEYPVVHTGTLTVSDAKEVVVDEDDEETPSEDITPMSKEECYALMRQAVADEFAKGCDLPDLTLEIDFIHIGDTEEYRQYRNLERVFLYDLVRIRHTPTGFVAKAQVSGYEWNALTRRYNSITVGNVFAVESSAVAGYQLTEGAVTATKIAPGSVTGSSLRELSVTNAKLAHAAVGTANIQDAAITRAQIADAAVGTAQIGLAAITQALIGAEAVGTTQIADGSITDAKIVELTANKINAGTLSVERLELMGSKNSVVYALNNAGNLVSQNVDTLDGDVLTERSITGDKIVANAITANEIASRTITSNEILAGTITGAEIAAETIEGANIKGGTITTGHVASDFGKTLDLSSNEGINLRVSQVYEDMDELVGFRMEITATSDILSEDIRTTALTARVWHGSQNVTDDIPASRFQWKRKSADETADNIWNAAHTGMKSITLTTRDVLYSATYDCELTEEEGS